MSNPNGAATEEEQPREEVIDPPAGGEETPAGGESEPEKPETPTTPTAQQLADTNRILAEALAKANGGGAPEIKTQEELRNVIRDQTGLSEAQIDWVMKLNRDSVVGAVAPLAEKVAWGELRASKANTSFPIAGEIEAGMQEELKNYPAENRGDPALLEKIYLVQVGKAAVKGKVPGKAPAPNPTPIVGRRIVTNNPAPGGAAGGGAGGGDGKGKVELSQEEKTVARKMGISEADYAKHKGNPVINGPLAPK